MRALVLLLAALGACAPPVDAWVAEAPLTVDVEAFERHIASLKLERPLPTTVEAQRAEAAKTRSEARALLLRGRAAQWAQAKGRVVLEDGAMQGEGFQAKLARFEATPGFWIPAVLYAPVPMPPGPRPVVLSLNGHGSSGSGKAATQQQMRCISLAQRGAYVLNVEMIGMGQLQTDDNAHALEAAIDLAGTSGVAPFVLALERGIDLLLEQQNADPTKVATVGLSAGGWQALLAGALDERVDLVTSVAGFTLLAQRAHTAKDLGDWEQSPPDLYTVADADALARAIAPKPFLVVLNDKDECCYRADRTLPVVQSRIAPAWALFHAEKAFQTFVSSAPGKHTMGEQSRERFYAFWSDAFGLRQDPREKKPRERLPERDALRVPLPDDNKSLRVLAREAAEGLPSVPPGPERLHALRALVRMPETAAAKLLEVSTQARRGIEARVLDVVLPVRRGRAVTLSGPAPKGRAIVLVDEGRARGARVARRLLDDGKAVTLFDPLFVGESRVPTHDWTWAILVSAVGERPLGLQVAEIIALARALRAETGEVPTLTAVGPRTSLMALVAAALAKDDVAGVELTDPLETLHALPVETLMPQQAPELYTFGLLSKLDVGDIAALVAPRPVHVTSGLPDRWAQRAP